MELHLVATTCFREKCLKNIDLKAKAIISLEKRGMRMITTYTAMPTTAKLSNVAYQKRRLITNEFD